jgi:hypothetical protein
MWIQAMQADPWAVEPRRLLAEFRLEEWRDSGPAAFRNGNAVAGRDKARVGRRDAGKLHDFELLTEGALSVAPLSCALWSEVGVNWREVYEAARVPIYGRLAANACRRAVDLYPTSPSLQFELARTLSTTGLAAEAKDAAREALRLDQLTPHADKKLSAEQRRLAERIISSDNSVAPPPTVRPTPIGPAKPAEKAGPQPAPSATLPRGTGLPTRREGTIPCIAQAIAEDGWGAPSHSR